MEYIDPLWIKLYVLLKGPVSALSISLIYNAYPWPYKVFYYNTNFFYKGRCQGHSFGPYKPSIPYIKL